MATEPFNIEEIQTNHETEINYEIHNEMQGIVYDNEGCGIYAEFSWSNETTLESIKFNCVRGLHQVQDFSFDEEAKEFHLKLGDPETPSQTPFSCEYEIAKSNSAADGYKIIVDYNLEEGLEGYGRPLRPSGVILRPLP